MFGSKSREEYEKEYLEILGQCYSTGNFSKVIKYLKSDCTFSSQWVFDTLNGKKEVAYYLKGKGKTLINNDCLPECEIVELINNYNKYGMLMYQTFNGEKDGVMVLISVFNKKIARIDLCDIHLFKYKRLKSTIANDNCGKVLWYCGLITKEFIDFFKSSDLVQTEHETFLKFKETIFQLSVMFQFERYEDCVYYYLENASDYRYKLAQLFYQDSDRPNLSDVFHSIKGNLYTCNLDEMTDDQLAVGLMYSFASRMGGSIEVEFAKSGRMKAFVMALYEKYLEINPEGFNF